MQYGLIMIPAFVYFSLVFIMKGIMNGGFKKKKRKCWNCHVVVGLLWSECPKCKVIAPNGTKTLGVLGISVISVFWGLIYIIFEVINA